MKNVIITGAANGVGKAVAKILNEENLILIDVDENSLVETAKETNSEYYTCDISNVDEINEVISDICIKYNKIDCLINCAGMWISGDMSKLEQPVFDEMNSLGIFKDAENLWFPVNIPPSTAPPPGCGYAQSSQTADRNQG